MHFTSLISQLARDLIGDAGPIGMTRQTESTLRTMFQERLHIVARQGLNRCTFQFLLAK